MFTIRPCPPFRLDLTAWALRRRARNRIDRWDGVVYRRALVIGGRAIDVVVRQTGSSSEPRLLVTATPAPRSADERRRIRQALGCLLGVDVDLSGWMRLARRDARLRDLADRFRGVKPPRFPTIFEALVNGFANQQLSLEVGLELLNRFAAAAAVKASSSCETAYAFPRPRDCMKLRPAQYRALGFSGQKTRAILELAQTISWHLQLDDLAGQPDELVRDRLLELRGVGRWTAEYVLLRGFGRLNVFPADDVGAQNRLARWLGHRRPLHYAGVRRIVSEWQPYAGMVYFHLLLDGLRERGELRDDL